MNDSMQELGPSRPSDLRRARRVRWLTAGGMVSPILFVGLFTLAGFMRPGYSPIHQYVSDLGVGSNAWLVDVGAVLNGLLLIGIAVGFALSMHMVVRPAWRWLSALLLALHGFGLAVAGLFTEARSTVLIHWLVGANLAFYTPVVAFLVTGLVLFRTPQWHRWGIALLAASLLTGVLIALLFRIYTPGFPLHALQLGGLLERVLLIEIESWYVVLGWRLFVLAREPAPGHTDMKRHVSPETKRA